MGDSGLGFKLTYAVVFFLVFLHIFFLIFFTESKIRLSSKFRTSFWKKQITGVQFNKILYLEPISQGDNCSAGYAHYPIANWPGTTKGIHLKEHQFKYPCQMILNKMENITEYRLIETFSSGIGDLYSKYTVDTPFDNLCYDKHGKCYCPEQLFTFRKYEARYPNHKIKWKDNFRVDEVGRSPEIPLSRLRGKTFCSRYVSNFTLFDPLCKDGVICNDVCIKGEVKCPDYTSFRNSSRMKKLFSDFSIDYKRFPCSALNKLISSSAEYPLEFNHSLSNYRLQVSRDKNSQEERCFSNNDFKLFEDIALVDRLPVLEIYSTEYADIDSELLKIDSLLKTRRARNEHSFTGFINHNKDKITEEQEYFNFAGITHFSINPLANDCSVNLIQNINSSFKTANKISQVNVTSINLLEFVYIYFMCYLFWKHFRLLHEASKPEEKFYYVKYLLLATFVFFCLNFVVYYSNREYKEEITESIKQLSEALEHKCFTSPDYNSHLKDVMIRLKQFSTLSFLLYENLLLENVSAMALIIIIIWSKVPLFEIFRVSKPETKDS